MNHADDGRTKTIFCLAGESGVGKSTVRSELCVRSPDDVVFLHRYTKRPIRPGEEDEVIHLDVESFERAVEERRLIAVFCANNTSYAVSVDELNTLLHGPKRWIGCIAMSVGLDLHAVGYTVLRIYFTVKDRSVLIDRLRQRGLTSEEIAVRMHQFDDADKQWSRLAHHIVTTDELSQEETVCHVAHLLRLPLAHPVRTALSSC